MNILQKLIFKEAKSKYTDNLFFRKEKGNSFNNYLRKNITLYKNSCITSKTFFNAFDLFFWKKYCEINKLYLNLKGHGKAFIKIGIVTPEFKQIWIKEISLDLEFGKKGEKCIEINYLNSLCEGLLFFELLSISDTFVFEGGFYGTDKTKVNHVKLGIVVTHFNRQKEVSDLYCDLNKNILNNPELKDKIKMVIVDNSRNLDVSKFENATVLLNKNLGGSGGFARGLVYLKSHSYTNCLFMDDDGEILPDCVLRIEKIFEYIKDQKTALSGILLNEESTNIIREMGATFYNTGEVFFNNSNIDLNEFQNLILIKKNNTFVNYGSWACFSFNISYVKYMPFPFFVRGDDIYFSLQNRFNIASEIGIACLVPNFELKEGPLTRYLDVRSTLLIILSQSDLHVKKTVLKNLWHKFFAQLYSYNYASCFAISRAISDICKGPSIFLNNPDAILARKYIANLPFSEKKLATDLSSFLKIYDNNHNIMPFLLKFTNHNLIRHLTINGLLLPKFCLWKSLLILPKKSYTNKRILYKHDHVYYYDYKENSGYFAYKQTKTGIKAIVTFMKSFIVLKLNYKNLSNKYHNIHVSVKYWLNIFKLL